MAKVLVAGDIHGVRDIGPIEEYFSLHEDEFTKDDYLILCGDTGICGFTHAGSEQTREFLRNLPVTVLFCDGNHENFAELNTYPVEEWHGGKVHRIESDIIHLMRGQIFEIAGRSFFVFGGAYSVDRDCRIKDISWFSEEMPSEEEYQEGWENLEKVDFQVDYIISHTGPIEVIAEMGFQSDDGAEHQTEELQRYVDETEFKHYFFGHFHVDEDIEEQFHCLMDRVVDLDEYV